MPSASTICTFCEAEAYEISGKNKDLTGSTRGALKKTGVIKKLDNLLKVNCDKVGLIREI
jgi:hypothetical protein